VQSPVWTGLAIAAAVSVLFAALFVVGERRYPARRKRGGDTDAGERKRRREIRRFLDRAGERYVEDAPAGGRTVAFSLPERDVAITFDAQTYFALTATAWYPILVEHEMPGAHLGTRLPFETPTGAGREDSGTTGSATAPGDAFAVLGLSADASLEEVRSAYRERVKEVHPDQGGDERSFRRVREAYADARRRAA
jgi:DnaJ-domain-containing protein 1